MKKNSIRWGAAFAVALFGLSACGSAGGGGGTPVTSTKPGAAGLKVSTTSLGKVLVDSRGMTVYMLTSDKPGQSRCASSCLTYWPPVAKLPVGARPTGVTGPVSSTTDTAGKPIATVGDWPLYTYALDRAPGDVTGQGVKSFGGVWYALTPAGQPVTSAPKSSSDSGGGPAGY